MIIGAHSIIYSTNPDADRAVLRDVFTLTHVDVGGGWLIFGLPPSEVAVHPSDTNDLHELYLMCDDVEALVAEMSRHNLKCGPVRDQGWGLLTQLFLPGGGKLGIYQPRHARPAPMAARRTSKPAGTSKTRARPAAAKKSSARQAGTKAARTTGTRAAKRGR
jgi:hypothetical protein